MEYIDKIKKKMNKQKEPQTAGIYTLRKNSRIFREFTKQNTRIVIFENDPSVAKEIMERGVENGYLRENFKVFTVDDVSGFLSVYRQNARYIQHFFINYELSYKGENLYGILRSLDVKKNMVWYRPEKLGNFIDGVYANLLERVNMRESDIVHQKHLLYSKRKSLFFELLTERLHKVADDEILLASSSKGHEIEHILREILATTITINDGDGDKELSLEYFLPVTNGLSIATIEKIDGVDFLVNAYTYIPAVDDFDSRRAITSGIRKVIESQTVGVVQSFDAFLEKEPDHSILRKLSNAGLKSSIYTGIRCPGETTPFGLFFGYSNRAFPFNEDHAETIQKLAQLVGLFYEKFRNNKEINLLVTELNEGVKNVRNFQDSMMGSELLSLPVLREGFNLEIDCYIRHPYIENSSFVSLNGDGIQFRLFKDRFLQITNFDICNHGIYPGMLGLITHATIDTFSYSDLMQQLLQEGDETRYFRLLAETLYNYYHNGLSKKDFHNISTNMAVLTSVMISREKEEISLLRLGAHAPLFYSAEKASMLSEDIWGAYNNMVIGAFPADEVDDVTVQSLPFKRGDILFIFSDGLYEQEDSKGEAYGTKRVRKLICDNAQDSVFDIKNRIIEDYTSFLGGEMHNVDDMSFIVIKRV